jgi:hypothetical protein
MTSHYLDVVFLYILRMIILKKKFKDGLKAPKILQIDQTGNNNLQNISY